VAAIAFSIAEVDHGVGIRLGQGSARKLAAPVRDGPEQRPLGVAAQAEPVEIGGQVLFKIMVVSFLPKT
jgi:hypothetical protein